MKEPVRQPDLASPLANDLVGGMAARDELRHRLPRWLGDLPASVPPGEAKIYFTRLGAALIGAFLHLVLTVLYAALGETTLSLINVGSVVLFIASAAASRSGHHALGIWMVVVEVVLHPPLMTAVIGLEGGYLIFTLIVAMGAGMAFPESQRRAELSVIVITFLSAAAAAAYTFHSSPLIPLEPWKLTTILCVVCVGTYASIVAYAQHYARVSNRAERRVEHELARSDQLLLNILPESIASRLKSGEETIVDTYPSATILFADIVGFTELASQVTGPQLVSLLNEVFSTFDRLVESAGLEKIKTIGDAYMAAAGLPTPREDHAAAMVALGLQMCEAIARSGRCRDAGIEIRIGIHTGPIIAGVIGTRKFAYDLWGDAVNLASRLESHGAPSRIQISEATRAHLGEDYVCVERGVIDVKGKGEIRTYWVIGRIAKRRVA